jgi:hypothetical protein
MTDLLTQLRAKLPGHLKRHEQLDRITAEINRRNKAGAAINPYVRPERYELEAMLESGEPLEELDQRVANRLAAEQAGTVARNALAEMRDLLKSEIAAPRWTRHGCSRCSARAWPSSRPRHAKHTASTTSLTPASCCAASPDETEVDEIPQLIDASSATTAAIVVVPLG